jgi:hypothetical protein
MSDALQPASAPAAGEGARRFTHLIGRLAINLLRKPDIYRCATDWVG